MGSSYSTIQTAYSVQFDDSPIYMFYQSPAINQFAHSDSCTKKKVEENEGGIEARAVGGGERKWSKAIHYIQTNNFNLFFRFISVIGINNDSSSIPNVHTKQKGNTKAFLAYYDKNKHTNTNSLLYTIVTVCMLNTPHIKQRHNYK